MKKSTIRRLCCLAVMAALLFQSAAGPSGLLLSGLIARAAEAGTGGEAAKPPESLDDVTIPTVTKNPNKVEVQVEAYPVYSHSLYHYTLSLDYYNYVRGVGRWLEDKEGRSPYFVTGIAPLYPYTTWKLDGSRMGYLNSNLPYRDQKPNVLQPELVLTDGMLEPNMWSGETGGEKFDILSLPYINYEQTYLRATATVLSGKGTISCIPKGYQPENLVEGIATEEPVRLSLDIPLNEFDPLYRPPNFSVTGGSMTDFAMALIDSTSPSVTNAVTELDPDSGILTLTVTFNEQLRWSHTDVAEEMDNIWVEVTLKDLTLNKNSTLRMYIAELKGNQLVFRGELGNYKYKNFRVERISDVSVPYTFRFFNVATVDTASDIYTSPYNAVHYGNGIHDGLIMSIHTTPITDHAGNRLLPESMVNWTLTKTAYFANSFEAEDVKIYNELTVNTLKEETNPPEDWPEDIDRTQLFAGPSNTLTVQIFTDQQLTQEESRTVTATLNILDAAGNPLKVACTSSYTHVPEEEVYGNSAGTPVTVLLFEDIDLSVGKSMEIAEGATPQVLVTKLEANIEGKEAYPVVLPERHTRQLYGDFDAPIVEGERLQVTTPSEDQSYHSFTARLTLGENLERTPYYAGVMTTEADFFISGGAVYEPIPIRYVITDDPTAPADASGYTEGGMIPREGRFYLGTRPVTSEEVTWYIHVMAESGELLLDDVALTVVGEDLVGNAVETAVQMTWQIDEIAPTATFDGREIEFNETNTAADVQVTLNLKDYNEVVSLRYRWGDDTVTEDPNKLPDNTVETGGEAAEAAEAAAAADDGWTVLEITPGTEVLALIDKRFGGLGGEDVWLSEQLLVKVTDIYGNESDPIPFTIVVSTNKPETHETTKLESDPNQPLTHPKLPVTGPDAVVEGEVTVTAYTRVTIADNSRFGSWEYVTVVPSGQTLDLFDFAASVKAGQTWYRVERFAGQYVTVEELGEIKETSTTDENDPWYDLLTHYGEVKISFENGYHADAINDEYGQPIPGTEKNMLPVVGQYVYENARGASYMADPNYFVVRYAGVHGGDMEIHGVDFGEMLDREGNVLKENSDSGEILSERFNATEKNVNPMRGVQIAFSISNAKRSDWGLLDLDFASSFVELVYEDTEGAKTVIHKEGLAGAATQYFVIPNRDDSGGEFKTGKYFVRVTVTSYSGRTDTFESVSMYLDAETVRGDGLWKYELTPYGSVVLNNELVFEAEDEPYRSFGMSVSLEREVMRSNSFAVYSGGVKSVTLHLQADESIITYGDLELGKIEGFRYWNLLSDPSEEDLEGWEFRRDEDEEQPTLSVYSRIDRIYTADTIPKGGEGVGNGDSLYLVKGVNTLCYQVKMENGYITPVRQITIIVSDHVPDFNMAIADYAPSHEAAQGEPADNGVVNAHSVTYFVEYAYSLNGDGEVDVRLYGTYEIEVTKGGETYMTTDPNPQYIQLDLLTQGLHDEDEIILKENSYTSDFDDRDRNIYCTAAFVAIDEFGGVTVVAPQLGDELRFGHSGATVADRYNLDYYGGGTDPYTGQGLSYQYNVPVYYGAQVTRFCNLLSIDGGDGEEVMSSIPELKYNLFNISTNDVTWGGTTMAYRRASNDLPHYLSQSVNYEDGFNFDLINWDSARIIFSGGDLTEEVILPLSYHGTNDAGYIGASYSPTANRFSFDVASIPRKGLSAQSFDMVFSEDTEESGRYPATVTFTLPGSETPVTLTFDSFDGQSIHYDDEAGVRGIVYLDADGELATGLNYNGCQYNLTESADQQTLHGTYSALIDSISRDYIIEGYNVYGNYFRTGGSLSVAYTEYFVTKESVTDNVSDGEGYYGVVLYLSMDSLEAGNCIKTGLMNGGVYEVTLTDYYGNEHTFTHTIETVIDAGTVAEFSTLNATTRPVTVTLSRSDGLSIYVDIVDYGVMSVVGNGSSEVTVTVKDNIVFSYRYKNSDGDEIITKIRIKNIVEPAPRLLWSASLKNVSEYYGALTVTLIDDRFELIDRYTGKTPTFTFHPDGDTTYVFKAGSIEARIGEESVILDEDIFVQLPVTLKPVADPLGIYDPITGERLEDNDTPNVQILAYTNQNGYYAHHPALLRVVGARGSTALPDYDGFEVLEVVGNRAEASELFESLGWASDYRFEVEINDSSRVRLFIKEGLYKQAPDYETGTSDDVPGVKLYSRLLTVSSPTDFTLFVVDKENNATSIAFHVTNVGAAPLPTAVKVPSADGGTVRVYAIAPVREGVSDFVLSSPDPSITVSLDEDTASTYYGCYYATYGANDDYELNYTYSYQGSPVQGILRTSVFEINKREISLAPEGVKWSENKALEATASDVIATVTLSEAVAELKVQGTYDESIVRYEIAGNTVTVTYTENHGELSLICVAANGTKVTVRLDAVTNIDRTGPEIKEVRTLAANGKSLILTMTSSERAIFREGGYVGTLGEDGLYYYERVITENGKYVYHFIDMAGIITTFEVEITELVKDPLALQYSLTAEGTDPVSTPEGLELTVGDTVYVKPSRDAVAVVNDGAEIPMKAGEWTPIVITDALGGILPYLVAEDMYGNVLTHQFSKIVIPDGTPPVLAVLREVVAVKAGTDRAEVEALLLANFTAFDDDASLTYAVEFPEDMNLSGSFSVVYKATDTAGNTGTATGKLRILTGAEPTVLVDGSDVYREATHILKADAAGIMTVDVEGRSYTVSIKSGIKTVAQMKIGSTVLAQSVTGTQPIELPDLESGYYTVCILTQDRDYFRMILYVE